MCPECELVAKDEGWKCREGSDYKGSISQTDFLITHFCFVGLRVAANISTKQTYVHYKLSRGYQC